MKLVLANVDYRFHLSSEGDELQRGLEHAGWTLAGTGYDDGTRDVPALAARWKPSTVFVQDKRDWDPAMGAFRKDVGFFQLGMLAAHPEIFKLAVIKDAGSVIDYHRAFAEEIAADALVTYYHDWSVQAAAPWMERYPLIRTYHSVNADLISRLDLEGPRRRAIVSGALNARVYPLRESVFRHAADLGCDAMRHPGYSNHGHQTPDYLRRIAGYRVSVATASRFGFALRKIIEAVAVGATPVTNLPGYDRLPVIDGALHRIPDDATLADVKAAIAGAADAWDLDERLEYARRACDFYDYRAIGRRLDALIGAADV
jgi:hypothetical protein